MNQPIKRRKLKRVIQVLSYFFPILGGAWYMAGSIVYWPTFQNVNPSFGGIFFIIGSGFLVLTDMSIYYTRRQLLNPIRNVDSFIEFCTAIGNFSFLIGSVYFLPQYPEIVGDDVFFLASIFLFIPQMLSIWAVTSLSAFTATFYIRLRPFKRTIIAANITLGFGCLFFVIGSYLFYYESTQSQGMFKQGVMMYTIGSAGFFLAPIIMLKVNFSERISDPLARYHNSITGIFTQRKLAHLVINYKQISRLRSIKPVT